MKTSSNIRSMVLGVVVLGLMGVAAAHHGNPEAPAPDWQGSLPPTTPAPQSPAPTAD